MKSEREEMIEKLEQVLEPDSYKRNHQPTHIPKQTTIKDCQEICDNYGPITPPKKPQPSNEWRCSRCNNSLDLHIVSLLDKFGQTVCPHCNTVLTDPDPTQQYQEEINDIARQLRNESFRRGEIPVEFALFAPTVMEKAQSIWKQQHITPPTPVNKVREIIVMIIAIPMAIAGLCIIFHILHLIWWAQTAPFFDVLLDVGKPTF